MKWILAIFLSLPSFVWGAHVGGVSEKPRFSAEEFEARLTGYTSLIKTGEEEEAKTQFQTLFQTFGEQKKVIERLDLIINNKKNLAQDRQIASNVRAHLLTEKLRNVPLCPPGEAQKIENTLDEGEELYTASKGYVSSTAWGCEEAVADMKAKLDDFTQKTVPGAQYRNYNSYVFPNEAILNATSLNCCKTADAGPVRTDRILMQRIVARKKLEDQLKESEGNCVKDGGVFLISSALDKKKVKKYLFEVQSGDTTYYCVVMKE